MLHSLPNKGLYIIINTVFRCTKSITSKSVSQVTQNVPTQTVTYLWSYVTCSHKVGLYAGANTSYRQVQGCHNTYFSATSQISLNFSEKWSPILGKLAFIPQKDIQVGLPAKVLSKTEKVINNISFIILLIMKNFNTNNWRIMAQTVKAPQIGATHTHVDRMHSLTQVRSTSTQLVSYITYNHIVWRASSVLLLLY